MAELTDTREAVRDRYAAAETRDGTGCCGGGCGTADTFGHELYDAATRAVATDAAVAASMGCGVPTAVADVHAGETVLDLGSGAGADVLISARRVGPTGRAIGDAAHRGVRPPGAMMAAVSLRSFDPRAVGALECRAWETYYRRKWAAFLLASVGLVRAAFRMSWPRTLAGAWLVLRANQKWAPLPHNDPGAARALMARFYRLLRASEQATFDPAHAAELEVEWWRAHRDNQHGGGSTEELVVALRDLYAYTYGADREDVRLAAALRAQAMDVSDRWVAAGCDPEHALLAEERALLIRSYAALLAAVHR